MLLSVFIWFKANKLTANINKRAYSIFKRNGEISGCLNSIRIDNEAINKAKEVKYLGIILDDKLNWKAHIDQLNTSLTKTIYLIRHRSIQQCKRRMAKQNSNKTESNTKSSLPQRFLRTNSKTAQRPGFAISKIHLKTKHTQIRAQARKQQNTQYIWKLLYWEQGQTQHKTNTQPAHEKTEWQLWKKQNAIQAHQTGNVPLTFPEGYNQVSR